MAKDIPPSRLNITYRTQVDGRPVQRKLPFRMLVLGDFSGRGSAGHGEPLPILHERPIQAIGKPLNGRPVTLPSLMKELRLGLPLPSMLTNDAEFDLEGTFEAHALCENDVLRLWLVTTELTHRAPSSRPEPKDDDEGPSSLRPGSIAIPVHAVQAELHCYDELEFEREPGKDGWKLKSTSKGRFGGWIEPETDKPGEPRAIYRIKSASSLTLMLKSELLDGEKTNVTGSLRVTARGAQHVPLRDMDSFAPAKLALATPELRRLSILRWLLGQVRTAVTANPVLRSSLKELLKKKEDVSKLRDKLVSFDEGVGGLFKIEPESKAVEPKPDAAPVLPTTPPAAPPAE